VAATTFDAFLQEALPGLARYANVLTGDRYAAEDLLQDTLVKAAGAWPRMRQDGNPVAYVKTVMVRTHVSWWRRHRPTRPLTEDIRAQDSGLGTVEDRDQLRRALAAVPPTQRAVLVLTYFDGADDAEIADLLQRRPATIRSLRHRGLQGLRRHLSSTELAGVAASSDHRETS